LNTDSADLLHCYLGKITRRSCHSGRIFPRYDITLKFGVVPGGWEDAFSMAFLVVVLTRREDKLQLKR
jgi:hypothetical protein